MVRRGEERRTTKEERWYGYTHTPPDPISQSLSRCAQGKKERSKRSFTLERTPYTYTNTNTLCLSLYLNIPHLSPPSYRYSPLNSLNSARSLNPTTLSNLSGLMTKVPLPPVRLLKCFKYPIISFKGTRAVMLRCLLLVVVALSSITSSLTMLFGDPFWFWL